MMPLSGLTGWDRFLPPVFVAVMFVLPWRRRSRMPGIPGRMPVGEGGGSRSETPPSRIRAGPHFPNPSGAGGPTCLARAGGSRGRVGDAGSARGPRTAWCGADGVGHLSGPAGNARPVGAFGPE